MFSEDYDSFFTTVLFRCLGREIDEVNFTFLGGGCINETVKLSCSEGSFFLKWNQNAPEDMFPKEAAGLALLEHTGKIRVPQVVGHGEADGKSYLLLEYLEPGRRRDNYWETFGRNLAQLHQCTAPSFGLNHDNYIGRLPQKNESKKNWCEFFIECRLKPQVGMALYNQLVDARLHQSFEDLYARLPALLPQELPALLHGDLWSGNVHTSPDGHACLIDPAVYFGHREMDLAFTKLFGGFDPIFYHAYHEQFPLHPGWEDRLEIFSLYPLMVHVNLFGLSYMPAVERTLKHYI